MKEQSIYWMKKVNNRCFLLALAVCSMLPLLSSCSSEENVTVNFKVKFDGYLPLNPDYEPLVTAILDYQKANGIIDRNISITKEGSDLTDEDFNEMKEQAISQVFSEMNEPDYGEVIREAGISISEPVNLLLVYELGPTGPNGEISGGTEFTLELHL